MADNFYTVVAETGDGETKTLPVRGENPSRVFQRVKMMPGVRRVGKVAEIDRATYDAILAGGSVGKGRPADPPRQASESVRSTPAAASAEDRRATIANPVSGPRVVRHARVTGGEQPFKHLQAPPERPKPVKPPESKAAQRQPVNVDQKPPAATVVAAPQPVAAEVGGRSYRIVKSRRRDGRPYLLQRGSWQEQSGKRTFGVEWEKDFDDRAKAEKHLDWLEHHERELAEVNQEA